MAMPDPLRRNLQSMQFTDSEIRRVAHLASGEASNIMSALDAKPGPGAQIRRAQIALAKSQADYWAKVGNITKIGIGDAVWGATEESALFDEKMFSAAGISSVHWRNSMFETAKQGMEALNSRGENGIPLATSVYKNQALATGKLNDTINRGLLLGLSQREIAKDVIGFIDPAVPGGASYAAMRLARSEVSNAYHQTALRRYGMTPWVERVRWNLSGSHPKPDECNEYAEAVLHKGWGAGEFKPNEVPPKPHPQCLCFITPVEMDLDQYAKNFKAGKYDDYIDNQMGCFRSA